jgi:hypothetical protein
MNPEEIKSQLLVDKDLLRDLFNRFDPFRPLMPRDHTDHPVYVHCQDVRGDEDILRGIGKKILNFAGPASCHLYTGHRGGGKSTELYRLKNYLEKNGFFVIYLNSDEDLDLQNVQHTDILLACTRRIVEELENNSIRPNALFKWLKGRGQELKNFGLSEIDIKNLSLEHQFFPGSKIVANIKTSANNREKIRKQVEENIVTFNEALNEFIEEARQRLPDGKSKLAVIVDNLDRIPVRKSLNGSNNLDELFIENSVQLKSLNCHLIYTVPIFLAYSRNATNLQTIYGNMEILPMVMVKDKKGKDYQPGINTIKELIRERINYAVNRFAENNKNKYPLSIGNQTPSILSLEEDIFDKTTTLDRLCVVTGGHLRAVMILMQESINLIECLPITHRAVERAIAISRNTYNNTVDVQDWDKLAEVSNSKKILKDDQHRQLLFSRCVLEYREADNQKIWYDVHPLLKEIDEFQEACQRLENSNGITQDNQEKDNQEKDNG